MEISTISSTPGVALPFPAQAGVPPQEQQARNQRSERERDDVARTNDQVTLSGASRQVAARENERVVPQTEVSASADKSQEKDRVEQARQAQIETQRNEQRVPHSVADALRTYTQTSVL